MRAWLVLVLWVVPMTASAGWSDDVQRCLRANDVPCADRLMSAINLAAIFDSSALALAAEVHFYAGRYPEAYDTMLRAVEHGFEDPWKQQALYERALYATAGWTEQAGGRFRIRYRPGVDAVLVEDALSVLTRSEQNIGPLLGGSVPGTTILEVFPDGRSFIAASSLTRDDVRATGVVALSKWSRLLLTSPRALGRGYEWQDTIAHEYIHLVVSHHTGDLAPVWFQEAIAKYLDNRWRDGTDRYHLSVRAQSLLAEALANDGLVPFSEMHPSLAKIKVFRDDGSVDNAKSGQRSTLAYAQLSSLMAFCFERAGDRVLLDTLPDVGAGMDPRAALAAAAGFYSFEALQVAWLAWLRGRDLIQRRLEALPTVLDGGTDMDVDPVLARRRDLARFVRLGDLLFERDRFRASLVEYDKALDEDDLTSPLLVNRMARSHLALGESGRAHQLLQDSLVDYPGFPLTWKTLGQVHRRTGRDAEAKASFEQAVQFNPFDIEVQQAVLELSRKLGSEEEVVRAEDRIRILRRGGEEQRRAVLHERYGEYELPRSEEVIAAERALLGEFEGYRAPPFSVETLAGESLTLEDVAGDVVLLDYWATWCGPCRKIMPELSRLHETWADRGLRVIGITDEDAQVVESFLEQTERRGSPVRYTIALDPEGRSKTRYRVTRLPTLFIIDRDGVVQMLHVGAGDMEEVEALVIDLLEQ